MSNEEDLSREQEIVDQTAKMKVLDDIKAYPNRKEEGPMTLQAEELMTVSEYIHYLENQVQGYELSIQNPPKPRGRDWVQKDIQIIMRDSGNYNFLEAAKIINLSGRVLVHRSERDFIRCTLDEAPENMRFTLIEEMPRVQKQVVSAVTGERNITITYDDGSSQNVPITPSTKDETSEEWD